MLASEDRQLLFKGDLKLMDGRGKPSIDLSAFLFTNLLLLTEPRSKPNRKEVKAICACQHIDILTAAPGKVQKH